MKKKYILFILIGIIILVCLFQNNNTNDFIRIRVIANSNSSYDLRIKGEIFDIVKDYISLDYSEEEIKAVIPEIKESLNKFCLNKNVVYSLEFGITNFPPKELDGVVISGGDYKTLLVVIGDGNGSNYWTLLYPDYYGFTFEDINSGEVEIKWYFYELFCK